MKRFIAIAFLALTVATQTEVGQLFKLPVLIHHYLEHAEQEADKSFTEFLKEHYVREINHPDDAHRDHENLPFKTLDFQIQQTLMEPCIPTYDLALNTPSGLSDKKSTLNSILRSYDSGDNIWQPPCLA